MRTIKVTGNYFATIHEAASNVTKNGANTLEIRIVGGTARTHDERQLRHAAIDSRRYSWCSPPRTGVATTR